MRATGQRQRIALALLGLLVGIAGSFVVRATEPSPPPVAGAPPPDVATTPQSLALRPQPAVPSEPAPPRETPAAVLEPTRVVIPAIDVDVPVVAVGLLDSGAMEVPGFGLVGWYELGPKPGEPGPAVLAGHVDSRAGPDVFFRLRELTPGAEVRVIDAGGTVARFTVQHTELVDKDALPVERIWDESRTPVLRLITCGGEFDRKARSYRSNTIVYAGAAE